MRRVVVTGLGAVTPLGLDAQSTWDAAVAGRSGVDWIRSFDASDFPVRIASEVKGFEPEAVVGPKDARRLERNVVLAVAAAREAWADAGVEGIDPARAGILVGSAIGGVIGVLAQDDVLPRARPHRVSPWFLPNVLVDSASGQIAIDLGLRGPNYAPVSACATGSHAVGEGAETIRRGDADVILAGGTESCMHPVILAGFCAMRGLVAEEEDPTLASRPFDATRAGFVMGEGACVMVLEELERRRRARRAHLRRGARLRDVERRAPHGAARSRVGRRRRDDARGARRGRASSPSRSATSTRTARRRRTTTWPRRRRSRRSSARTRTSSPSRRRSRCSGTASGRRERSRR